VKLNGLWSALFVLPALAAYGSGSAAFAQTAETPTAQPSLVTLKADFIPGDKTLFYDDFTDMEPDAAPPHWKVRGGSFALQEGSGFRQFTVTAPGTMTPNLKGLPKNFTVEADIKFENPADSRSVWTLEDKAGNEALRLFTQTQSENLFVRMNVGDEDLGYKTLAVDWSQPIKLAWWMQNGRVRVYANGQRLLDVNQVTLPAIATVKVENQLYGDGGPAIGYRMVRIAESTPDFSKTIASAGRYVTHGILFDTDSDRLKPESAAVIKSIARGLEANPSLKLLIEGHTDSTGSAAHNLELSKRRAEAVKDVLVSQFGVDGSRLTAAGLGATKPLESNDTPAGRAQNRRVEFVRQ
jgi:OOP family OmpA-OmpF porin